MAQNNSDILRAFFKGTKKLYTNFNEATLTSFLPAMQDMLCDENGVVDVKKFSPSEDYTDLLRAYCTIVSLKQANKMYNDMFARYQELGMVQPKEVVKTTKTKTRPVPKGWRVIQGGKAK